MTKHSIYDEARAKLRPDRFGVPKTHHEMLAGLQLLQFTAKRLLKSRRLDALETNLRHLTEGATPQEESGFQLWATILRDFARNDRQRQRADNIRHCRLHYIVAKDDDGPALLAIACRDRMCLRCQMEYYGKIRAKTEARTAKMRSPQMLTLTLKQNSNTCDQEITRLLKCFARLRRHKIWQDRVRGGIYAVELVPRADGRTHHVHLHAIIDTWFLSKKWISKTWLKITGDSFQIELDKPRNDNGGYIAKYASKGATSITEGWNPWDVADKIKGRRLCGTFGNVPALCKDDEDPHWEIIDTLPKLLRKAHAGDPEALETLEAAVARAHTESRSRGHP